MAYKPYNIKEYQAMNNQTKQQKLGGLGANIGSDRWEEAQRKKEAAAAYAEQIRHTTTVKTKPRQEKPRELTAREKAIIYANSVPKPKAKQGGNGDLDQVKEEEFDSMGNTINLQ